MWKDLKLKNVGNVKKCVAEFEIWAQEILPCDKMKVKVYESPDGFFCGYTDVTIIRKADGFPEGAAGGGITIEEALNNTINFFMEMVEEDYPRKEYPHGLPEKSIEYVEFSDF